MASEAVMVAPEQCATAPKTLASKQAAAPAAAKTSTTRVVLLAVLALAAATGAMFGVVVFGNEFTKDMHPKGATLVDSEDRAVATAAVESYVSLLDLPLLGTAELNKVDGITFSTHKGIEHRKVTGYTVTKETAAVGDSEVHTPRLSLATSAPGETIEVSVRDNKAWLRESAAGKTVVTAVDSASQRRLADGGSCLENGACLYSRDELLHLDAASRRLEEGSFFARADVAAYQVELDGDVMPYLAGGAQAAYLAGSYSADGHRFELRAEETSAGTTVLFTNFTSGKSKLLTREGAFIFAGKHLVKCDAVTDFTLFADLSVQTIADDVDFETVDIHRGQAPADFIAVTATKDECLKLTVAQANMSSPEALERFPKLAHEFQTTDMRAAKKSMFKTENRRKLSEKAAKKTTILKSAHGAKELVDLMMNPNSGHPLSAEELAHPDGARRLAAARASRKLWGTGKSDTIKAAMGVPTSITNFELWVATRMADPTYRSLVPYDAPMDADWDAATQTLGAQFQLEISGQYGITTQFAMWSGFQYVPIHGAVGGMNAVKIPGQFGSFKEQGIDEMIFKSMQIYSEVFPGTCAGGFTKGNEKKDMSDTCMKLQGSNPGAEMICQAGGDLLKPLAWGSFLTKDEETVLAFAGTQMQEFEMFQYTILAEPIFFEYKNYYVGFKTGAIVTEGLALYVFQLLNCLDFIIFEGAKEGGKIGYMTGHSLGGAAASLYAQLQMPSGMIGTQVHLVTFGAPATMNRQALQGDMPDLKYYWGSRDASMTADAFDLIMEATMSGMQGKYGDGCQHIKSAPGVVAYIPGSIRYMHKFDPVPSMGWGFGRWSHGTEYGMLLWDMPGCDAGVPECAMGKAAQTGNLQTYGGARWLESYLCMDKIQASGKLFQCAPEYYSYSALYNPMACVEVYFAQIFMYDSTYYSGLAPFLPFEDAELCATSYGATVEAYIDAYFAADIKSSMGGIVQIEDASNQDDYMMLMGYYGAWTLFYVHMTYPNYPMCGLGYGTYEKMNPMAPMGSNAALDMLKIVEANVPSVNDIIGFVDEATGSKTRTVSEKKSKGKSEGKSEEKVIYTPTTVSISAATVVPRGRGK